MRTLVSDYSGHPFPVQLSRNLARRGHAVLHDSAENFQTPKGNLTRQADDPPSFESVGVWTRDPFAKGTFIERRAQEIELIRLIADQIVQSQPYIVISGKLPLDAQCLIQQAARQNRAGFVFWAQELFGGAIGRILSSRMALFGRAVGRLYTALEAKLLRCSDHTVAIADDFLPPLLFTY